MKKKGRDGFTLIELLVVIAVLGILAAVVLVAINPAERLRSARDAGAKSDIGQIATGIEAYYTDNEGTYPVALTDLTSGGYLKAVPGDPTGGSYTYTPYDSTNGACAGTVTCVEAAISYVLEQTGTNTYCYQTVEGKAKELTAAGVCNYQTSDD